MGSTVSRGWTVLPPLPQPLEVHLFRATLQPMSNVETFLALESCA